MYAVFRNDLVSRYVISHVGKIVLIMAVSNPSCVCVNPSKGLERIKVFGILRLVQPRGIPEIIRCSIAVFTFASCIVHGSLRFDRLHVVVLEIHNKKPKLDCIKI